MKTVANYPEDFTCKYSSDEFNYGKAELYLSGGIGLWKKPENIMMKLKRYSKS